MKHTFKNGPLDATSRRPKRFIQVVTCDGVNTEDRPDMVDRTVEHGTYVLTENTTEGPVYVWKGKGA